MSPRDGGGALLSSGCAELMTDGTVLKRFALTCWKTSATTCRTVAAAVLTTLSEWRVVPSKRKQTPTMPRMAPCTRLRPAQNGKVCYLRCSMTVDVSTRTSSCAT